MRNSVKGGTKYIKDFYTLYLFKVDFFKMDNIWRR